MTCKSSSCLPKRASGSILPRMSLVSAMTFWAASWLFQKVSPAICDSSSAKRWFNLGTSKKPPQVGQLVGGGGDLWFDKVEHARRKYPKGAMKSSGIIGRSLVSELCGLQRLAAYRSFIASKLYLELPPFFNLLRPAPDTVDRVGQQRQQNKQPGNT